jgi:ectoine hydroxylase-related dioxygenase (phytanoyl-CoA dioxygenase family)
MPGAAAPARLARVAEQLGAALGPAAAAAATADGDTPPRPLGATDPEPVFSEAEMAAWRTNGWIVLRDAVPAAQCAALVDAIWAQLGQDPADPTTWYAPPRGDHHDGFVGALDAPRARALQWEMCQSERLYAAHAQLFGTPFLRMGVAGAYMKPPYIGGETLGVEISGARDPNSPGTIFQRRGGQQMVPGGEMALHFDTGLEQIHTGQMDGQNILQSQISLTDTPGDAGGTCLLPGFHNEIADYAKTFPPFPADTDMWESTTHADTWQGWPGRNANTAWPHAFKSDGTPVDAPLRARLKAELKGAGRIREHWRGNLHHVDLELFQSRIRSIPTHRGDLLIWHRACPHGNGYNLSANPRFAQFVNFSMVQQQTQEEEEAAAPGSADESEPLPPALTAAEMDANNRSWEEAGRPALTELGRCLLGMAPWPPAQRGMQRGHWR